MEIPDRDAEDLGGDCRRLPLRRGELRAAAFWREAREQVDKVHPGCIWLAESVHAAHTMAMRRAGYYCATDTELYDAFDITYDYDIWPISRAASSPPALSEYTALVNFQESEYRRAM